MRYFSLAHVRSTRDVLINTLTLDGMSSRHIRILLQIAQALADNNRDKRWLWSHREYSVTSCSSASNLQNVGNRQRTHVTIQSSETIKVNRHATRLHEMIKADAESISQKSHNESSRETRSDTAKNSTHDNSPCLSHTKYDNDNYAYFSDTAIFVCLQVNFD